MNMTGMSCDIDVGWDMLNYTEKPAFGPQVGAYIVPELPGRWQGFLQMAHGSDMIVATFQFDVYVDAPNNTAATTDSMMNMTMSEMTMSGMTMGHGSTTGEMVDETMVATTGESGSAGRAAYSFLLLLICIILLNRV